MEKIKCGTIASWSKFTNLESFKRYETLAEVHNALIDNVDVIVKKYEDVIKVKDIKARELEDTVERLQSSLTLYITPESLKREILRLYAKGNSSINIHKILTETKKTDVEYEVISDIIVNLKNRDLSSEDLEFYASEVKFHLENNTNQEDEMRVAQIRQLEENQNSINDIIAKIQREGIPENFAESTSVFIQLMKEKRANADSMAKLLKGSSGSLMGSNEPAQVKDTERFEKQAVNALLNFSEATITYEEVM